MQAEGIPLRKSKFKDSHIIGYLKRAWAHQHGIALRLIEPDKPNQNA
jgi:hypothetical protein